MTTPLRALQATWHAIPTREGAGVRLKRAFGFQHTPQFDPFLMLDDFSSNNPEDYMAGFPWHPHRGIETITYLLEGCVEHADSMGNKGSIKGGEIQWMTAGSGIIHQEMPTLTANKILRGFQLWANLPADKKMTDPRYQSITQAEVPVITAKNGTIVRLICGVYKGIKGPVQDIYIDPTYMDISLPAQETFVLKTHPDHNVFAYGIEGHARIGTGTDRIEQQKIVLFTKGDELHLTADDATCRFLLIAGNPLNEPIAWGGPIVMNTQEELQLAFMEYSNNTFIKHK